MIKSLYDVHEQKNRELGEVVLNWRGALVTLILFLFQFWFLPDIVRSAMYWYQDRFNVIFYESMLNLFIEGIMLIIMVLIFGSFYWENLKRYIKDFKDSYILIPFLCLAGILVGNTISNVALVMLRGEVQEASNNTAINSAISESPIIMMIVAVILAPIVEETIFRAGFCRSMTVSKKPIVKILGYVISISVFALIHVFDYAFLATNAAGQLYFTFNYNEFISILNYLPMAIGFGLCASLSKNFWTSVTCHMAMNVMATLPMVIRVFIDMCI